MNILIVNAGDVGHCIELATSFHVQLKKCINIVDTLTPFPESFTCDKNNHYCIPASTNIGLTERYEFIAKFIGYTKKKYDLILFFTFDELLSLPPETLCKLKTALGHTPITGIYYSSSYWRYPDKVAWCLSREQKLSQLNIPIVFSPDPKVEFIVAQNTSSKLRFKWLPDFTSIDTDQSSNSLTNLIKRVKNNRKVIGLVGSLGKWKGVYELLSCIYHDQKLADEHLFVFSGELVEGTFSKEELSDIKKWILELDSKIIFNNKTIASEGGFNQLVDNCDIIYAVYNNPQSSGLISKSIKFKKSVLYPSHGFIQELMDVLDYNGEFIDVNNVSPSSIRSKINALDHNKCNSNISIKYRELLNSESAVEIFVQLVSDIVFSNRLIGDRGVITGSAYKDILNSYNLIRKKFELK